MRKLVGALAAGVVLGVVIGQVHAASPAAGAPGGSGAAPEGPAALFQRANEAFDRGDHQAAIAGYERLLELGRADARVLYNLGTALARADRLGPALYALRRAAALDPGDAQVQRNLEAVRARVAKRLTRRDRVALRGALREPVLLRFAERWNRPPWAYGVLVAEWLLLGLLLWRAKTPRSRRGRRQQLLVAAVLLGLWTAVGLVGVGAGAYYARTPRGLVLGDRVPVREGPNALARSTFEAVAGLPVELTSQEAGWVKVRLHNGLEGWLPQNEVGRL